MAKEKRTKEELFEEAKTLGVSIPRVQMSGFKSTKPVEVEKEKARVEKEILSQTEAAIAKKKANAKKKPIDKRRELLEGRFKAVKTRQRAHTYSNKNIEAWLEEYNMIKRNPKGWNKITQNGKLSFTPGNKKKQTAKDILDGMDFDDTMIS